MKFGVCYYPEHWPAERWAEDARLMRQAGITYVRIAEFAWQLMEPAEGDFDWAWLDTAIETLAEADLRVVLCTPTAAPPVWMAHAYPDILPVDAEGRALRWGTRRHYCVNSATYRRHTERIVTALAERYGQHPAVAGWQIDNEFGCHDTARCYCDECAAAFRRWLEAKYGTLDALNAAWGTVFWSQIYVTWEQVMLPNLLVAIPNPAQVLDYYRFASDSNVAYQQAQLDLLREGVTAEHFITTNVMGDFDELDYHALAHPLDFIAWDSYPTGYAEHVAPQLYPPEEALKESVPEDFAYDVGDPYVTGFYHDVIRGLKQQPFWVMEQQAGHINWGKYNPGVRPGTPRLWAWHALACGADAVLFFRWRACRFAQELYHSGLLRHDGNFDVGYSDLLAMRADAALLDELASAPIEADVALVLDYEDLWAMQLQPHREGFDYRRHLFAFYRAAQRLGVSVDVVSDTADLSRYRLVLTPTAFLADVARAERLTAYVEGGGTLLLGVRSGFKTPENAVPAEPLPGPFRELTGVTVTAWHALPPGVRYPLRAAIPALEGPATLWAEALSPHHEEVEVLARYVGGPFHASAALTSRVVGAGRALTLGWHPTRLQAQALLAHLIGELDIARLADLPRGVIARRRGEATLLLNFTDTALTATVQGALVPVPPRDVVVV